MKRRLLNVLTALSLLLCVAVGVLRVLNQWHSGWINYAGETRCLMVASSSHVLEFLWWEDAAVKAGGWNAGWKAYRPGSYVPNQGAVGGLGLTFYRGRTSVSESSRFGGNRPYWVVTCPHWILAVVAAALPALWLYRRLRRPYAQGLCPRCGYDLRATPGRCPECGTQAKAPA